MSNFTVNDIVRIRKRSPYFAEQGGHGDGTVMNIDDITHTVEFEDGYANSYQEHDLTKRGTNKKGEK